MQLKYGQTESFPLLDEKTLTECRSKVMEQVESTV